MEKSDKYIEYEAYIRYLRKVTGEPVDAGVLKEAVLAEAVEKTELQTALSILKSLAAASVILFICAVCAGGLSYFFINDDSPDDMDLWSRSRVEGKGTNSAKRLYEAYEHSMTVREKFF